jgi:hypothetical protein
MQCWFVYSQLFSESGIVDLGIEIATELRRG